jgi:septal ring factor EnvC (AmiA/AmiB activator)
MDAHSILKEFGLPAAIIVAAAWFLAREVWPFIKQRVEVAHSDRLTQQKEFFDTLARFTELVTTQRQATLSALAQLTEQMEEVTRTLSATVSLIEQLHKASTERERTRARQ